MAKFATQVIAKLQAFDQGISNPDQKHNTGSVLGLAFMWDEIADYAKKQSDRYWAQIEKEQEIDKAALAPGEHILVQSPHFVVRAKVTNPVRRFDPKWLAERLSRDYKKPVPYFLGLIDGAKLEGKSNVSMLIIEKGE